MSLELRNNPSIEIVARSADGAEYLDGYAAVFNEPTIVWDFEEIIAPGAFTRALKENQDVRALFNHDPNFPLARTKNGTLIMREDKKGLWTESKLSKNPTSDSIADYVRTGLVSGMSFAFTVRKQEWQFEELGSDKLDRRIITEIGVLYDIGPVTYPAYEQTSVKIRAEAKKLHDEARARWEQRRSSVQVPTNYELVYRECRSAGDVWEVETELHEKREAEPNEQEKPVETPAPVEGEKAPETPSEEPKAPSGEGSQAEADPSEGTPEPVEDPIVEASRREIEIKRRRFSLIGGSRRS